MTLLDRVHEHYEAMAQGDPAQAVEPFDPSVRWIETAGSDLGGEYVGPEAILQGVFAKIGQTFVEFRFEPESFNDCDSAVFVVGTYVFKRKLEDSQSSARVVHVWRGDGQSVKAFEQFADTAILNNNG